MACLLTYLPTYLLTDLLDIMLTNLLTYIHAHICMHIRMHECMYVCMYACMYVCICVCSTRHVYIGTHIYAPAVDRKMIHNLPYINRILCTLGWLHLYTVYISYILEFPKSGAPINIEKHSRALMIRAPTKRDPPPIYRDGHVNPAYVSYIKGSPKIRGPKTDPNIL